jgi:hypothetical protein
MTTAQHEEGDLRVWWIPQIPMSAFHVDVETVEQGRWLCDVLADYDTFQLENNVKPDYSNAGGVQQYEIIDGLGDWYDVDDEDEDD